MSIKSIPPPAWLTAAIVALFLIGAIAYFSPDTNAQRTASNPLGAQLNVQDAGTCSTTNSFAWQTLPTNAGTTTLNLSGTFTATVTVRESNNGGGTWSTAATLTTTGTTTYATNGFTDFCADVTAFTSGIVQVSITTGLQQVIPGSSSLAGTNGQLLFNNNGVFGGAPFTFSTPVGFSQAGFNSNNSSGNSVFYVGPTGSGNTNAAFGFASGGGIGADTYRFYSNPVVTASTTTTQDFAIIVAAAATTPTTPVGSTTILTSAPSGTYRLTVYYVLTTAGVGGTAITLNVSYTDAQQAQTNSSVTSSGLVLGQFVQSILVLQQQAAGNITYTITETGTFSTHPVLALKLYLEKVN